MKEIIIFNAGNDVEELTMVLQESFLTVAREFNITKDTAPTNPAFIQKEKLLESMNNGLRVYILKLDNKIIGCVGIEKSKKEFFIERLAVLPEFRHNGYGSDLLKFSFVKIVEDNGNSISIGIIDKNTRLKEWYKKFGFEEKMVKNYDHLPFSVCFMEKNLKDV